MYGMIQALRRGRLPSNGQLDAAFTVLRDKLTAIDKAQDKGGSISLSSEGRAVVLDVRDIVETVRLRSTHACPPIDPRPPFRPVSF